MDRSGNLYFADQLNHRVRVVNPSGIISTAAGNGTAGFAGDAASATSAQLNSPLGVAIDSSGNLYIADTGNHRIRKVTSGGIISTFAGNGMADSRAMVRRPPSATLNLPVGVAVDTPAFSTSPTPPTIASARSIRAAIFQPVAGNGGTASGEMGARRSTRRSADRAESLSTRTAISTSPIPETTGSGRSRRT